LEKSALIHACLFWFGFLIFLTIRFAPEAVYFQRRRPSSSTTTGVVDLLGLLVATREECFVEGDGPNRDLAETFLVVPEIDTKTKLSL
jgi:hypothetical protein